MSSAAESNGWAQTFNYDQYGNMWLPASTGLPLNGAMPTTDVYNAKNQNPNRVYDAAGNQTGVDALNLTYDAENRAVAATITPGGGTMSYQYDGAGQRVGKVVGGVTTVYVYDAFGGLAAEYSASAAVLPLCVTCYVVSDHLGSTSLVTDQNANVVARHDFTPFGQEIPANTNGRTAVWGASDTVNLKFTGQYRDAESGLDYFGARYYGAALGRWTSPDQPLVDQNAEDPQSWNLYGYVRNNPLANVDRWGLDCITTSNQSAGGVTVTTEQGGSADTCSGTYVEGTVDTSSYKYDGSNLTYCYSNDNASGAGTIGFGSPRVGGDSADISPFGASVVGSVGARTDASYQLMGAFAAGSIVGGIGVANGLALAGSGVADGLVTQAGQYLSKAAARALAQRLATTAAQAAAAASAISRATSNCSVRVFQDGSRLAIQIVRLGRDGFQEIESVIDQAGGKDVVQKAINNAGDLVHYDPK